MPRRGRSCTAGLLVALVVGAAACGAVGAAPASAALTLGIADQKPDVFGDARFAGLGLRHARISVGWDALTSDWQREELDRWMFWARVARVRPLVTFGHSRTERRRLPTPERFKWEFRRFRERYPWVREFATWNEANHCGQPTCHRARLVAAYWRALRRECPRCRILAAEVLDMPNMVRWVRSFRRHAYREPRDWGLHNYVHANRFRTLSTRRLLRHTRGRVWLTEVGGLVTRRNRSRTRLKGSPWHAYRTLRFLFDEVVPLSRRIQRVYVYHWNALGPGDTWDSALIDARGRPRPAFGILEDEVALQRLARRRGARSARRERRRLRARQAELRRAARRSG